MRVFAFLTALLFLISCNDKEDIQYKYSLSLSGNTAEAFSNMGEGREFTLQLNSEPLISTADAEVLLKSSEITFRTDSDNFIISDIIITGNTIKFIGAFKQNQTENRIEDQLRIYVVNEHFNLEVTKDISQEKSLIRHEYRIESETINAFTIPAEGGSYTIPIRCMRITYINEIFDSAEPYSLSGIRYTSNIVNIGWGHHDRIYKTDSVGHYAIELNVDGPYNIDYDYLWTVELLDGEKVIYSLNIFHPETAGEEYYMGSLTRWNSYLIDE